MSDPAALWPVAPAHPERVCWGCDKLCPSTDLTCGNGTERTPHPIELFGEDWWASRDAESPPEPSTGS